MIAETLPLGARPAAAPRAGGAVALRCAGLVKRYADVVAVDGLDLEVQAGECFGLLGPNGAGKTTTIEILEGLNTPDAGEVEVLGRRWATDASQLRQRLGIHTEVVVLPAGTVPRVESGKAKRRVDWADGPAPLPGLETV